MATDFQPAVEGPLADAWRQLGGRLTALMTGAKLSGRSPAFIRAQLVEVESALALVTQVNSQWVSNALPEAYGISSAAASVSLSDAGVNPGPAQLGGIDRRALRALVERVSGDLELTRAALIEGLALGDPRRSVERVLSALDGDNQLIRVDGNRAKVETPSGKMWDAEAYARMLGRTAIADARRVAFRQRYLSNGIDLVKVVANGTTHAVCRFWEGKTLSLTGATPGFPTVDQARASGLFHPNCRHRYVVDTAALADNPQQVPRTLAIVPEGPLSILGIAARSVPTGARARTPTTIRADARRAARLRGGGDTNDSFRNATGQFTPERQALHRQILRTLERSARRVIGAKPILQLTGGGSASGKGTFLRQGKILVPDNQVLIDPDEIKTRIPEFDEMIADGQVRKAAGFVHEESSLLSKQLLSRAATLGTNMTLDGTGDGSLEKLTRKILPAKQSGYLVKADYVYLDTEEAVVRSTARAKRSGREVPEIDIRSTHKAVSTVVPQALEAGLFDEFRLWDNTSPEQDLIARKLPGQDLEILKPEQWDAFLAKADEDPTITTVK